ncbi:MAG: hypothetical protein KJS68_05385 [Alphaproteobacteria bacterium]|nr:hypothetical protein [Alphaproteobacteria bacterium]
MSHQPAPQGLVHHARGRVVFDHVVNVSADRLKDLIVGIDLVDGCLLGPHKAAPHQPGAVLPMVDWTMILGFRGRMRT